MLYSAEITIIVIPDKEFLRLCVELQRRRGRELVDAGQIRDVIDGSVYRRMCDATARRAEGQAYFRSMQLFMDGAQV